MSRIEEIGAEGMVPASPQDVFDFLSRLENHWQLADRWIEVVALDSATPDAALDGGAVRIRGPLGLARTVRTRVLAANPPTSLRGSAEVGRRTAATIIWSLAGDGESTRISIRARVERMGVFDRVLWRLGGGRWMRRRFRSVVSGLAARFAGAAGS